MYASNILVHCDLIVLYLMVCCSTHPLFAKYDLGTCYILSAHLKLNNPVYFHNVKLTSFAIRCYHSQSYHNFITDFYSLVSISV